MRLCLKIFVLLCCFIRSVESSEAAILASITHINQSAMRAAILEKYQLTPIDHEVDTPPAKKNKVLSPLNELDRITSSSSSSAGESDSVGSDEENEWVSPMRSDSSASFNRSGAQSTPPAGVRNRLGAQSMPPTTASTDSISCSWPSSPHTCGRPHSAEILRAHSLGTPDKKK